MKKNKGFTLMELLIVVAIIGILASIAWPSYQNSIIKGNRASAKSFLMEVVQREQQYLLDNRSYATSIAELQLTAPPEFTRFYTVAITVNAGPPPSFTVRATPIAGSRQAADGWLQLSNTNVKSSQFPSKW